MQCCENDAIIQYIYNAVAMVYNITLLLGYNNTLLLVDNVILSLG